MDFFTKKEINYLKGEIIAKEVAVEAEKYAFEKTLKNGLADEIIKTLNNPPKPSLITKIKIKYNRWKQQRKELKEIKKRINDIKNMGGL
jgi:hypothetical protein